MQTDIDRDLGDGILMELAGEIARGIYTLDVLLARFRIAPETFERRIKGNRRFLAMLGEAAITWDSTLNAKTRIKVKGEAMFEKMMLRSYEYYQDASQPLAARVQVLQTVAKVAGLLGERGGEVVGADAGRPSDRVNITINLSTRAGTPGSAALVIDQPSPVLPQNDPINVGETDWTGNP